MSKLVISGGKKLRGTVRVNGSKNAALPMLAASLLTTEPVKLESVPEILDVENMLAILESLGVTVERSGEQVLLQAPRVSSADLDTEKVGQLRGSILLLGALLGREGSVRLPQPGGDVIGARPIDVHLDGLRQLGVVVKRDGAIIELDGSEMKAGRVVLQEFSVTATENVLMAAARLPGTTRIEIAASEPHVVALCELLQSTGVGIAGAGTHTIEVTGNEQLRAGSGTVIPDMLEAGFFVLLGAATKSDLRVENVPAADLSLFFKKLDEIGVVYTITGTTVHLKPGELRAFKVQTLPQPGIATDLQAPFAVLATQVAGTSLIHDPMYESRFRHCDELVKMGAAITVCDPHRVVIEGPTQLRGQHINSLDIRSGATLVLAGLVADGETVIEEAEVIDRGYAKLVERLQGLGADIKRVDDDYVGEMNDDEKGTFKSASGV